ncbi:MAG: sporulation histidine kinase inhibitor Sda [Bacillus sp. (in: firmicutes)]
MSSLKQLSDKFLIDAYIDARKLKLSSDFIRILREEMFKRKLNR